MKNPAPQKKRAGHFWPALFFISCAFSCLLIANRAEAAMRVWFEIKPQGSGVMITPFLEGSDKSVLRYELQSETHSMAGNSQIRQAGGVIPLAGKPTPITQLRMSPTQTGECEVTLRIFDGDNLLAEKKITDCRPAI